MPRNGKPLSADEVAAIRAWIAKGAKWPAEVKKLEDKRFEGDRWWSLSPLVRPDVPRHESRWVRTPVDAFVLDALAKNGLSPSSEADRRTLIRRLAFDLVGLPPTIEEVEAFVADEDPRAYERLVDRLLDSPRYGERWGRHWLDVVHYGDTHGYDKDKVRPNAWPYRDYVIRSFNAGKPYARFVEEQLAGDVLYPDTSDGIAALGFIAAGPWDFVGHVELREGTTDKEITRSLDRDDMLTNAMSTFSSLTVHCARCHNHKFDPIPQQDYYRLQAVFAGVERANRPYDADRNVAARRRELEAEHRRLESRRGELAAQADAQPTPERRRPAAAAMPEALRTEIDSIAARLDAVKKELAALPPQQMVFAAASQFAPEGSFTPPPGGKPREIRVLHRGSVNSPGEVISPGTVRCVAALESRFDMANPDDEGARRAALAKWIVDKRNPLTWRSIINRVWQYHFGTGIVATPNDFGRMGSPPTHPELLDWLAVEFRDSDQSLKSLHRLLVTSSVYRQVSTEDEGKARIDAGNRYLWRMNRRRLEAEAIRDATLAVAGKLDLTMGGPGFREFGFQDDHSPRYKYQEHDPDDPKSHRRSVYRFIVRSVPDPFLDTLDCADASSIVAKRNETVTALQALALLNNKFMLRMAESLTARAATAGATVKLQVHAAFRLAFARDANEDELAVLVDYAEKHGLANACRVILNMNEFVFVD
jgi:hypothetical protein